MPAWHPWAGPGLAADAPGNAHRSGRHAGFPVIPEKNLNRATVTRFYSAFAQLDPASMATCYAPSVRFQDEVFTLDGRDQVMAMWFMLCESLHANGGRRDWKLNYRMVSVEPRQARLEWSARYHFGKMQRPVHNRIQATLRFDEAGLITHHHDSFDFWRWSRQALGMPGVLLGWSPMLRRKVRARAQAGLARYMAELQSHAVAHEKN